MEFITVLMLAALTKEWISLLCITIPCNGTSYSLDVQGEILLLLHLVRLQPCPDISPANSWFAASGETRLQTGGWLRAGELLVLPTRFLAACSLIASTQGCRKSARWLGWWLPFSENIGACRLDSAWLVRSEPFHSLVHWSEQNDLARGTLRCC